MKDKKQKKRMGRPPIGDDKRKVKLHISVDPSIATIADQIGVSKFFNAAGRSFVASSEFADFVRSEKNMESKT